MDVRQCGREAMAGSALAETDTTPPSPRNKNPVFIAECGVIFCKIRTECLLEQFLVLFTHKNNACKKALVWGSKKCT